MSPIEAADRACWRTLATTPTSAASDCARDCLLTLAAALQDAGFHHVARLAFAFRGRLGTLEATRRTRARLYDLNFANQGSAAAVEFDDATLAVNRLFECYRRDAADGPVAEVTQ